MRKTDKRKGEFKKIRFCQKEKKKMKDKIKLNNFYHRLKVEDGRERSEIFKEKKLGKLRP